MSKKDELKKIYDEIELDSTSDRQLLSRVKNGEADYDEIDELIDIVSAKTNGGKKLDEIKIFETTLIADFKNTISNLDDITTDYNDAMHLEDELEKNKKFAKQKEEYRKEVKKAEEIIEAMKIAYFQIKDYAQYEDELEEAREPLYYFE